MKELYNELFRIPKNGKIREKAMLVRTAVTVVIMLACLAAMSFTAYAFFSYSVTSDTNTIRSAHFEADVSIAVTDANGASVEVKKIDDKTHKVDLEAGKTYLVTLEESADSTAKTGFCLITADGCGKTYHTQQLGADAAVKDGRTEKITFELKVSSRTTVTFLSHWGTSSYYGIDEPTNEYITNDNIGENAVILTINKVIYMIDEPTDVGEQSSAEEISVDESLSDETTSEETTFEETESPEIVHTVADGETISVIAALYGVSVSQIVEYNGIENPDLIFGGQQLKIPPAENVDSTSHSSASDAAPDA